MRDRPPSRRSFLAAALAGLAGGTELDPSTRGITTVRDATQPSAGGPGDPNPDEGPMEAVYAPPGDVQAVLDAASESATSVVRLYPEMRYDPAETWEIPGGVTLAYDGAVVAPTTDRTVHDVRPGGRVRDPVVDLRRTDGPFSSSVFRFDSERFGFYGEDPVWYVRGGMTWGRGDDGTVFEFRQGGETAIYFVHVDHSVRDVGTVVDMHRGDAWGINGCRFYGVWYGFDRGIRMRNRRTPERSVDNISGNHFDVIAQPSESEILWDMEAGHFNVLRGRLWDFGSYRDVMWRVHDRNAEKRIGNLFYWFPVGGTEEHLVEDVGPSVFDDRLGDPRNRVVVPWQLGQPVGRFSG